jgi:hypothetical protein
MSNNRHLDELWQSYQAAEQDRIRAISLERLDQFLLAINNATDSVRRDVTYQLMRTVADEESLTPIRMPLFRRLLFPVLREGVLESQPHCARWLAYCHQHIYQCNDLWQQLAPIPPSEIALLREALRVDAGDTVARVALIKAVAWQLEYAIHEIPSDVLYGNHGASTEQCDDLIASLKDFKQWLIAADRGDDYAQLCADCELHFSAYKNYQSAKQAGKFQGLYVDYLRLVTTEVAR